VYTNEAKGATKLAALIDENHASLYGDVLEIFDEKLYI